MPYSAPIGSPYDPAVPNLQAGTIELADVLLEAQRALSLRLRVALPCKVLAVDGNQKVQVQTLIKVRYKFSDTLDEIPPIGDVPVLMPRGANYAIKLPVAVGDTGLVVFTDRSLDVWLADPNGGTDTVDPQDTRAHDINDAVFVPGLTPFAAQGTDNTTDLVISNGTAAVRLLQNGTLKIGNANAELLTLLDSLIGQLASLAGNIAAITVTCPPGGGPSTPPLNLAAFTAAQAQLTQIQTTLNTIKAAT